MKFTLTFDGELGSQNGSKTVQKKWDVRKQFHPQLSELWRVNPLLINLQRNRQIFIGEHHDPSKIMVEDPQIRVSLMADVCKPISIGGREFIPLVRQSLALKCSLKIIFLRKEEPGKLIIDGDIDNRIKVLLDSLTVPKDGDQVVKDGETSPIYCLLEDDSLITGYEIQTHQLLRPNISKNTAQLIIEVDVKVVQPYKYNLIFLGN